MPELPEVETIRRSLAKEITGHTITRVRVRDERLRVPLDSTTFAARLPGKTITAITRRGKVLSIELTGGWTWIVHFGMTGKLIVTCPEAPIELHTHVQVSLEASKELRYVDIRRFGQMALLRQPAVAQFPLIAGLGIEPFSKRFNVNSLTSLCLDRKRKIRDLIIDQRCLAGLGNIYAQEILHDAAIRPDRVSGSLSQKEIGRLVHSTRRILRRAIQHRGTSVRDYLDGNGRPGRYQRYLKVYQRHGLPCLRCASPVRRIRGARSSFYCPACQT
jgi:formamidopyrimidine-DNA glycosylase